MDLARVEAELLAGREARCARDLFDPDIAERVPPQLEPIDRRTFAEQRAQIREIADLGTELAQLRRGLDQMLESS
jgi:hypothetical protein